MTRRVLPQRRPVRTFDLVHRTETAEQTYTVSVGYFCDGDTLTPGEIFLNGGKIGSAVEAIARDAAILLSIMMQHGIDVRILRGTVTREASGAPASIIGAVIDKLVEERDE
jgi:hypothetical protein